MAAFGHEYELRIDKPIDARKEYEFYNLIVVPFLQTMNIIVTFEKDLITFTIDKDTSETTLNKAIELLSDYMGTQKRKIIFKKLIKEFVLPSTVNKNNATNGNLKPMHSTKNRNATIGNINSLGSPLQRQSNSLNYKMPAVAPAEGARAIKGYIPNNYYNGLGYGYGYTYEYDHNDTNFNQVQSHHRQNYQNGRK